MFDMGCVKTCLLLVYLFPMWYWRKLFRIVAMNLPRYSESFKEFFKCNIRKFLRRKSSKMKKLKSMRNMFLQVLRCCNFLIKNKESVYKLQWSLRYWICIFSVLYRQKHLPWCNQLPICVVSLRVSASVLSLMPHRLDIICGVIKLLQAVDHTKTTLISPISCGLTRILHSNA